MSEITIEVEGADGLAEWFRTADERVDRWILDLVDDTAVYSGRKLVEHAPGTIKDLVSVDEAQAVQEHTAGSIEAVAGVHPDLGETEPRGLGSSSSDYPYFVDVGTGIYGEFGTPITSFPGGVMGPFEFQGRMIYARSVKGQPAQDYSGASFRDTNAYLPLRIEGSLGGILGS